MNANAPKSDGHILCYAKRPAKVQISLHRDFNPLRRHAHGRSHHLTSNLRTRRRSPEQKVTGTGPGTGATDPLVGFGTVDGTP
ncbi:MAG TPA: hypothetical protein VJX29_07250 [Candidatus Acidoferrales bacterium]|nr:hypothetical protein [Candidatus Acidoferrales bacterium]